MAAFIVCQTAIFSGRLYTTLDIPKATCSTKKIILAPITFFKKLCSSSLKMIYIVKRKNRVNINAVIL